MNVEERLARLEQAVDELRAENRQLRRDISELLERVAATEKAGMAATGGAALAAGDGAAGARTVAEAGASAQTAATTTAAQTAAAIAGTGDAANAPPDDRRWFKNRIGYVLLMSGLIAVPVLAWALWHANTFWSAVIGAVNALIVYFIGPGAVRLLAEGLLRAIPGVLLGQTARITLDSMRKKKAR